MAQTLSSLVMRVTGVPTSCTLCSMRSSRRSATLRTMGSGSLGASASVPQIQLMVLCAARSAGDVKVDGKDADDAPAVVADEDR